MFDFNKISTLNGNLVFKEYMDMDNLRPAGLARSSTFDPALIHLSEAGRIFGGEKTWYVQLNIIFSFLVF